LLIIFDLDGTLIDSAEDLAISMNATRRHFGLDPLDKQLIYSYVGNGAAMLVRRAMGLAATEESIQSALAFFLKFYRVHALEHTRLYPGVKELIQELAGGGHKLAVLTNKPVRISADIVKALGLGDQFFRVYGGDSFAAKKPDPVGVLALVEEARTSTTESLLVGDSAVDVQTSRNAGVSSAGVLWGFQPESFQLNPPDIVLKEPQDLLNYLNRNNGHVSFNRADRPQGSV
jgi:phosphoglycolate phosphatase